MLVAEKGPEAPETQAAISQILLIARVDVAVLLLVIIDMVAKPFLLGLARRANSSSTAATSRPRAASSTYRW